MKEINMSNDLISRSALKKAIATDFWEHFTAYHDSDQTTLIDMVMDDIEEIPTAYDVDVVIQAIKDAGEGFCGAVSCNGECSDCDHGIFMKTLVEIVRNGGKKA